MTTQKQPEKNIGSILVMMLVMISVFAVIMISAISLVAQQQKVNTVQGSKDQSANSAEAGANFAWWALQNEVLTPTGLKDQTTPIRKNVNDPDTGNRLGDFSLMFTDVDDTPGGEKVTVISTGRAASVAGLCNQVTATFLSLGEVNYKRVYAMSGWRRTSGCPTSTPSPQ